MPLRRNKKPIISRALISESITALEQLKHDVETGKVSLRQRMTLRFTDDPRSFFPDFTSEVTIEPIGSISGKYVYHVVIYQKRYSPEVSFGILNEPLETCYPINAEQVMIWMMPTDGNDIVERDLIIRMNEVVKKLSA